MKGWRRLRAVVSARVSMAYRRTELADALYRFSMKNCPHPLHRILRLDDHGRYFDFCTDCREEISR